MMNASVRGWLIAIGLAGSVASLVLALRSEPDSKPKGVLQVLEESVRVFADVKGQLPASLDDLLQIDPRVGEPFVQWGPAGQGGRHFWIEILDSLDGRFRVGSDGADGVRGTSDDRVLDSRWVRKPK